MNYAVHSSTHSIVKILYWGEKEAFVRKIPGGEERTYKHKHLEPLTEVEKPETLPLIVLLEGLHRIEEVEDTRASIVLNANGTGRLLVGEDETEFDIKAQFKHFADLLYDVHD